MEATSEGAAASTCVRRAPRGCSHSCTAGAPRRSWYHARTRVIIPHRGGRRARRHGGSLPIVSTRFCRGAALSCVCARRARLLSVVWERTCQRTVRREGRAGLRKENCDRQKERTAIGALDVESRHSTRLVACVARSNGVQIGRCNVVEFCGYPCSMARRRSCSAKCPAHSSHDGECAGTRVAVRLEREPEKRYPQAATSA